MSDSKYQNINVSESSFSANSAGDFEVSRQLVKVTKNISKTKNGKQTIETTVQKNIFKDQQAKLEKQSIWKAFGNHGQKAHEKTK